MREMKDSGIEWIGKIPLRWDVARTKYNFANRKQIVGYKHIRYNRLALTLNGVIHRSKEDDDGLQPERFDTYQILQENEIVFKLIDLQNISTSRVGRSLATGIVSPAYLVISQKGNVLPEFAEYWFLSMWHRNVFNQLGDSGVRSSLNSTDLLNLPIAFPNISAQQAIADFLNQKCAEIDDLTADIRAQIDTLEQYKHSLITETISAGIGRRSIANSNDVPWICGIPHGWKMSKVKYEIIPLYRSVENDDEVITCFRDGQVTLRKNRREDGFTVSITEDGYHGVNEGDLVIHGMDTFAGAIGCSDSRGKCSPVVHACKTSGNNRYFMYCLRSMAKNGVLWFYANGVRVRSSDFRNFSNLGRFSILVPPQNEQDAIVEFLDNKCECIDSVISLKKFQISTLDECKKSLIYEYVTGKKEVLV